MARTTIASTTEQQILNLLSEILQVVKPIAGRSAHARSSGKPNVTGMKGIHAHQSKYNPWRAYVWDKHIKTNVYLGAFPSISKAKAAQTAYRKGTAITSGTKAKLSLVA